MRTRRGDGEKKKKRDGKRRREIVNGGIVGGRRDSALDRAGVSLAGPPLRKRGQTIKTDDFLLLLESDYPLEAQREPYKSLLIKTGPFIDGLMSLGH